MCFFTGRVNINALPQRCAPTNDMRDPLRTTMSSRKPLVPRNNTNKGRRSCMPEMMVLPPPRHSISERKAIPGLDNIPTRLPTKPTVRKELNFDEIEEKENKIEEEEEDDDSNFAKPFPVKKSNNNETSENEKKSLARMILMRESLAGLPRASLSGLFRQSLSIAELDRMFDDDSTQSFEDLERRLKTPAKLKASSRLPNKPQQQPEKEINPLKNTELEKKEIKNIDDKKVATEQRQDASKEHQQESEIIETNIDNTNVLEAEAARTPIQKSGEEILSVSIYEYEIDDSQLDDEEIEKQLLQRSMSMGNLSNFVSIDDMETESKLVPLAKSTSLTDLHTSLNDLNPESSFLKSAVEALEEHRQEQAIIEQQIQNLMERSLKRREQFRAVWGVSPKSINQKRDLKTVLNVQKVGFSLDEENLEAEEETKESNDVFFGIMSPEKKVDGNEEKPIGNYWNRYFKAKNCQNKNFLKKPCR